MFVERDKGGVVVGLYGARQEGYAEEELPDDHAEVVAYLHAHDPNNAPTPRDLAAELDALIAVVLKKTEVTEADIEAEKAQTDTKTLSGNGSTDRL